MTCRRLHEPYAYKLIYDPHPADDSPDLKSGFWKYFCVNATCVAPLLAMRPYNTATSNDIEFAVDLKPLPLRRRPSPETEAARLEAVSRDVRAAFRIARERARVVR